jgi:hypothetical protein
MVTTKPQVIYVTHHIELGTKATLYSIQQSFFVPASTSKFTSRHHGIQAVTRVMAYIANAVMQSSKMRTEYSVALCAEQLLRNCTK